MLDLKLLGTQAVVEAKGKNVYREHYEKSNVDRLHFNHRQGGGGRVARG